MSVNNNHKKGKCEVCKNDFSYSSLFPLRVLRCSLVEKIVTKHPKINRDGYICQDDLRQFRTEYIESILEKDKGALSQLDEEVIKSLRNQVLVAEDVNKKFEKDLSFGERVSDGIAQFGGSWKFILSFLGLMVIWMIINTFFFASEGFDPYPFILLNLVLSCLAAIQAPIIMMSQNRQSEKERMRSNEDYVTNLKAELEIQQLHSKLDLFMKRQWETLIELQKIQIELVDDLLSTKEEKTDD